MRGLNLLSRIAGKLSAAYIKRVFRRAADMKKCD
jgi:hypothetical protein